MALPDDELRKFQFVILCLNLGDEIPQINNLFRNNHIDHIVLQQVEAVLTRTQRHGVLQLLRETLSGNYALLDQHVRYFRYLVTVRGNPVTQELSGVSENGNVVCTETREENETCEVPAERFCDSREDRDLRMGNPRVNPIELPLQEEEPFRSPQALSSLPESTSAGNSLPEVRMQSSPCCVECKKDIQVMQNSRPIQSKITYIIKRLSPLHFRAFITEMKRIDSGFSNFMQSHGASFQPSPEDVVHALLRCHSTKCVLCLVNSFLYRIGSSDPI